MLDQYIFYHHTKTSKIAYPFKTPKRMGAQTAYSNLKLLS